MITNPEAIARYICATNTRQYTQSANTPFVMEPLATYVGHHADNSGADDLLAYCNQKLYSYCKL